MADTSKKFSDLSTASQVNNSDLVAISQEVSGSGWASFKATILALATKIATGVNFTSDLQTTAKTLTGAINEAAQSGGIDVVADEFDATSTYAVGDYVTHEGSLYKCTTAVTTAGAWDSNDWTETLVMDEVSAGGGGGASWTDVTGTLSAGSTTITLSNVAITTSSTIDVYTGTFGVSPTNIVVSTGSVTLTFAEQSSNLSVKVRVS